MKQERGRERNDEHRTASTKHTGQRIEPQRARASLPEKVYFALQGMCPHDCRLVSL
jgi:hypothetical protein